MYRIETWTDGRWWPTGEESKSVGKAITLAYGLATGGQSVRVVLGRAIAAEWISGVRMKNSAGLGTGAYGSKESRDRGRRKSGQTMKARAKAKAAKPKTVRVKRDPMCVECKIRYRQQGDYCRTCAKAHGDNRTVRELEAERIERNKVDLDALKPTPVAATGQRMTRVYEPGRGFVEYPVAWDGA